MIYLPKSRLSRLSPIPDVRTIGVGYGPLQMWHGGLLSSTTLYNAIPYSATGGRDGTLGSAVTIGNGRFGLCPKFGGGVNDYVDIGTALLQGQNDWSLSAWFCPLASGAMSIYGESNSGNNVTHNHSVTAGQVVEFDMNASSTWHSAIGTTTINVGEWYHYLATFSSTLGGMKLYLDGRLEASDANTASTSGGTHGDIGGYFQTSARTNNFNGYIDLVTTWNRALAPEEVQLMYLNPLTLLGARRRRPSLKRTATGIAKRGYAMGFF